MYALASWSLLYIDGVNDCRAALEHSTDMAVNAYFSHLGSNNRTLQDRAEEFGFDTFPLGENIAAGYNTVRDVVLAWMWWVYAAVLAV